MRPKDKITKKIEKEILDNLNEITKESIRTAQKHKADAKGKDNNIYFIKLPRLKAKTHLLESKEKLPDAKEETEFALSAPQVFDARVGLIGNKSDPNNIPYLLNSFEILRRLNILSPFIQPILYHEKTGNYVTPREGCDLNHFISNNTGRLNFSHFFTMIMEFTLGLEELHKSREVYDEKHGKVIKYHGIAHSDLHDGNILVSHTGHLLISDLTKLILVTEAGCTANPAYIPYPNYEVPEYQDLFNYSSLSESDIFNPKKIADSLKEQKNKYSKINLKKVDIFKWGKIAAQLAHCINKELLTRIEKSQIKLFIFLIGKTQSKNPLERPTIHEIRAFITTIKYIKPSPKNTKTLIEEIFRRGYSLFEAHNLLHRNSLLDDSKNEEFSNQIYAEAQRSLYSGQKKHYLTPSPQANDATNLMPPDILDLKIEFQSLNNKWQHLSQFSSMMTANDVLTMEYIVKIKAEKLLGLANKLSKIKEHNVYKNILNDIKNLSSGILLDLKKSTAFDFNKYIINIINSSVKELHKKILIKTYTQILGFYTSQPNSFKKLCIDVENFLNQIKNKGLCIQAALTEIKKFISEYTDKKNPQWQPFKEILIKNLQKEFPNFGQEQISQSPKK